MDFEQLPSNWKWSTILELVTPDTKAIVSGPFGSNIGSRFFVESGVPVIRGNNLTQDLRKFVDAGFVFVTPEKATELGNVDAVEDDLIFTAAGTIGQVGIIPKNSKFKKYIISNKQLRARLDKKKIIPKFAFYWFSSPNMVEYIQQQNTGSTIPLINLGVLKKLPIPVPNSLDEQLEIVNILSSLDNKIELNQRMNDTLEGIAQALFKSWFVDFDPVKAKAEGHMPEGMDDAIALLFPNKLESGIPYGWDKGTMEDLFILQRGFDLPQSQRISGKYPILAASGPSGTHHQYMMKGPGVTTGRSGVLGNVFFVHEDFWPLNTSLFIKEYKNATPSFAYFFLQQIDISAFNAGSAVPTLNRNHIHSLAAIIPQNEVIQQFDKIVMPLFKRQRENQIQINTLSELRDILLPRLISGKLRVGEISETVEALAL